MNDVYGHATGDLAIIAFSKIIRAHIRGSDILARFGGDEFIVIMKQMKSPESALKKCQEICRAFREDPIMEGLSATASAGVAMWDSECSINEITQQVDAALYHAKESHDGQCILL